jgi:hypothetical protein
MCQANFSRKMNLVREYKGFRVQYTIIENSILAYAVMHHMCCNLVSYVLIPEDKNDENMCVAS